MNYYKKYLKYKKKYLDLKGGSLFLELTDENLQKYTLKYSNYEITIYGEHHSEFDYTNFINKLKTFIIENPDKKFKIVLELNEDWNKNGGPTSKESERSISFLLAKAYIRNEFKDISNIEFIYGDSMQPNNFDLQIIFDRLLYNIIKVPNKQIKEKFTEEENPDGDLLDIYTIKKHWKDELELFKNTEYIEKVNRSLDEIKEGMYYDELGKYIDLFWCYWVRLRNDYTINKIKDYFNNDNNIIIITGQLHLFDYVFNINKEFPTERHYLYNKLLSVDILLKILLNQIQNMSIGQWPGFYEFLKNNF